MSRSPYFEIIEGTDGKFRISLAEKYARKFAQAIGGLFISPAFTDKQTAERVGWSYISESTSLGLKEQRRPHKLLAAQEAAAASAQESLF